MSIGGRLKETLSPALGIATVFSLWVVVLMIVNSSTVLEVRGYAHSGFAVIAVYYLGGAAAALVAAILMPLARWTVGAALVGVVAALPVTLGIAISADGIGNLEADDYWAAGITAVALGGLVGVGFSRMFRPTDGPDQ